MYFSLIILRKYIKHTYLSLIKNKTCFQGPELFSKYVGDSEKSVRELFKKARQVAPCILFIDEIETLGLDRSNLSNSGGGSVQERVLLQFLTELDGFTGLENVLLVAATNRPDRIDEVSLIVTNLVKRLNSFLYSEDLLKFLNQVIK